jgi:hypothetical protein
MLLWKCKNAFALHCSLTTNNTISYCCQQCEGTQVLRRSARYCFPIITTYLSWSWVTCWPVPVSRIQKYLHILIKLLYSRQISYKHPIPNFTENCPVGPRLYMQTDRRTYKQDGANRLVPLYMRKRLKTALLWGGVTPALRASSWVRRQLCSPEATD